MGEDFFLAAVFVAVVLGADLPFNFLASRDLSLATLLAWKMCFFLALSNRLNTLDRWAGDGFLSYFLTASLAARLIARFCLSRFIS